MKLLDQLDRKYSKYAIHNLMSYIIIGNVIVFIMDYMGGVNLSSLLVLDPRLVMQGQVWRLVTFVFIPPSSSLLWIVFALLLYNMIGRSLEYTWGSFKFNVYYFLGMIFTIFASLFGYFTGRLIFGTPLYLNLTLFLAFATLNPDYPMRIYFVLSLKIKYLAYLNVAFLLFSFLTGGSSSRFLISASLINYILFFGKDLYQSVTGRAKSRIRQQGYANRMSQVTPHKHKCYVCGRTEEDDPNLEFRFCSKCDGYYEYCSDHLKNHEHVKEDGL